MTRSQKEPFSLSPVTRGVGNTHSLSIEEGYLPLALDIPEHQLSADDLMESICSLANLNDACRRVLKGGKSPGIDGMSREGLRDLLRDDLLGLRTSLLEGSYRPSAVREVKIPKPDGGERKLGIPTFLDRLIQQALHQVLHPYYEQKFVDESYGFRPRRSTHQAMERAREYANAGYEYVVDIDLEQFFEYVNHDRLMSSLSKAIKDKRVLRLIGQYLRAGVMIGGIASPRLKGTPQGGPLSPLLSNIVLHDLDLELKRRSLHFVRYADDCNIYVRSERAAQRVLLSVKKFIENKLKLKVNQVKSGIRHVAKHQFLGFGFFLSWIRGTICVGISSKSIKRFRGKIKTRLSRGRSLEENIKAVAPLMVGFSNYYRCTDARWYLKNLESWVRRRLRAIELRKWRTPKGRRRALKRLGVRDKIARSAFGCNKGWWRLSRLPAVQQALSNYYLACRGLPAMPRLAV